MTSHRKVKDASEIPPRKQSQGQRRTPLSPYHEQILACLGLEPPEGILIETPEDVEPEKFRRRVRAIVSRNVVPFSSYRFKVTLAADGSVLVACLA